MLPLEATRGRGVARPSGFGGFFLGVSPLVRLFVGFVGLSAAGGFLFSLSGCAFGLFWLLCFVGLF